MAEAITKVLRNELNFLLESNCAVRFIQIGASDAVMGDPLYPMVKEGDWKGVLFEPLEQECDKIRKKHPNSENLTVVNKAVHPDGGEKTLYKGVKGTSSLGPATHKSTLKFDIAGYTSLKEGMDFEKQKVECIEPAEVFRYEKSPHLIVVDAEGLDVEIIDSLPLQRKEVQFLMYEGVHHSKEELEDLAKKLKKLGYEKVAEKEEDLLWKLVN